MDIMPPQVYKVMHMLKLLGCSTGASRLWDLCQRSLVQFLGKEGMGRLLPEEMGRMLPAERTHTITAISIPLQPPRPPLQPPPHPGSACYALSPHHLPHHLPCFRGSFGASAINMAERLPTFWVTGACITFCSSCQQRNVCSISSKSNQERLT